MSYTSEDVVLGTLMAFREAAGEGDPGIIAVLCVARNNALKKGISFYDEVAATKFRYSSMNCPVNVVNYVAKNKVKELQQIINALSNYPKTNSPDYKVWLHIQSLVIGVLSAAIQDITNGATLYYSTAMMKDCPFDQSKIVFTAEIGHQKFYKEI